MSNFGKWEKEQLQRLGEASKVDPVGSRKFVEFVSRHIERQKQTIAEKEELLRQAAAFLTGGVSVCTCPKCYGAAHLKSYKCPREVLLKNMKVIHG